MEFETYLRFLLALVFVIGLIAAVGWLARRFGVGGAMARAGGRSRRLSIVEVTPIDPRRKLLLVRRDAVEHLVLLGPGQDLLLEGGIAAPAGDAASFAAEVEKEVRE